MDKNLDTRADSTLGQQIYQQLERKILLGEWLPNSKVTLRTLALSLNTSMQPVREAVGRLVAASALEATPNRAFRVPELDRTAADEIWSLRFLLEGEAAARFAARREPTACARLAAATDACRAIDYGRDLKATMGAITTWNLSIIQAAGSQLLYDTVMRIYLRYAPFLANALSAPMAHDEEFLSFILHIQIELRIAITAGDVAAARYLRCADLRSFQRYLYERIGWSSPATSQG
jgi:DNA-binding GntR family transcriptional regulator